MSFVSSPAPVSGSKALEEELHSIPLYQNITALDRKLTQLVMSMSRYAPDSDAVDSVISLNTSMLQASEDLTNRETIHLNNEALREEVSLYDNHSQLMLNVLSDSYSRLSKLPSDDSVVSETERLKQQRNKINSANLLDYAMKLAKFTKIPPTFDRASIGPNNFVWPAEDALRKGMLAIASLDEGKLTETRESHTVEETKEETEVVEKQEREPEPQSEMDDESDGGLDMDLFNPDDLI